MYRALGAVALLTIAIAAPVQDAAAQDPVGGAILGGAAGAILGGAMGGGRGAAIGAIVGGATGAAIAAQGQPRPGGYRYYQQGCYQERGDGAWVVVAPEYCAPAAGDPRVNVEFLVVGVRINLAHSDARPVCVFPGLPSADEFRGRAPWRS